MFIFEVLRVKGYHVETIHLAANVELAVRKLAEHRIGALVVSANGTEPQGILSERDIVQALGKSGASLLQRRVEEIMTKTVVTCAPQDRVADLMALMTERRIRHVPVIADGAVVGIVSIGDVVKFKSKRQSFEIQYLTDYITAG